MTVEFLQDYTSTAGAFTKGFVLEASNQEQLNRWIARGVVKQVVVDASETGSKSDVLRKAVGRKATLKAVVR